MKLYFSALQTLILIVWLNFLDLPAYCQSWSTLQGSQIAVPGNSRSPCMAKDMNGNIFIAYGDVITSAVIVKKFDGNIWTTVGNQSFHISSIPAVSMTLDASGSIFVGFSDGDESGLPTVIKFDGNSWTTVGNQGFGSYSCQYVALGLSSNQEPMVAFSSSGGNLVAMEFDGTQWTLMGQASLSAFNPYPELCIQADNAGNPYIAFGNGNGIPTIIKYDGNNWNSVGTPVFAGLEAIVSALSFDNNGKPYIGTVSTISLKSTVMSFDGTNWNSLDPSSLDNPLDGDDQISVVIDAAGNPYAFYLGIDGNAVIKHYNGSNWSIVGSEISGAFTNSYVCSIILDISGNPTIVAAETNGTYVGRFDGTNWNPLVSTWVSDGPAAYPALAISSLETIYVGYRDDGSGMRADVKEFDGTNWINYGNPDFSDGEADNINLAFSNKTGNLFISYKDVANSSKLTVMENTGIYNWSVVSTKGFSAAEADFPSLALDKNGTPYVAFSDAANNGAATVMKFDGMNWVTVGNPGFTSAHASYTSVAIDTILNIPYLVFSDASNSGRATVMKFNGAAWVFVGNQGFTPGTANHTSLAVDQNENLLVAFADGSSSFYPTVMKFNGTGWATVGTAPAVGASLTKISIGPDNSIYVAYQDYTFNYNAEVIHFDGTNWNNLQQGLDVSIINYLDIAITPDDRPILAKDGNLSVLQFTGSVPLPITLLNFTGQRVDRAIDLSWQTATEENSSYFVIGRYDNSGSLIEIGEVSAAGNSNTLRNYSFTDHDPQTGVNFYQLEEYDLDGHFTKSKVISISFEPVSNSISIYPNPAHDMVYFEINSSISEKAECKIIDPTGRLVIENPLQLKPGSNHFGIPISILASSTYFIHIEFNSGKKFAFPILKQ
jgi:Secretion system C-terminal sorting domain